MHNQSYHRLIEAIITHPKVGSHHKIHITEGRIFVDNLDMTEYILNSVSFKGELHNCLSCNHIIWKDSYRTYGTCNYPLPAWVDKHLIVRGILLCCTKDGITTWTEDRSRCGYKLKDGSVIEIEDCPTHSIKHKW